MSTDNPQQTNLFTDNKQSEGKEEQTKNEEQTSPNLEGFDALGDKNAEAWGFTMSGLAQFDLYRITDSTPISPPVPIITINGETISTEGNLTTISGDSKSGKSAFTSMIIAGAISLDDRSVIDGLEYLSVAPNKFGKAVIHFDTEQSRHKHQKNLKSILRRANYDECPQRFCSYNIRELELDQYQTITGGVCEAANKEFGGIHLIVIDGLADYIRDANDADSSFAIIKYFLTLAAQYSCPVMAIVHTNPGSDKERGHLGSQCQRKSESVIQVKKDNGISYIQPKFLREAGDAEIPRLQFTYCKEKGYHVDAGIQQGQAGSTDIARIEKIRLVIEKVFSGQNSYHYGEAIEKIMAETNLKERTSKDYFKEAKAHGFIEQGADSNWRLPTSAD